MVKHHNRKMIAPIVVSVLMVAYYVAYFGFLISLLDGVWRIILGVLPFAFIAVTLKVCVERIIEIKKGEEDDISKY